jgi:prepilin peptidase CpaA
MMQLTVSQWFYAVALGGFVLAAAWSDSRTGRIPNWLNVTFFVLGLGYRVVVDGWVGLGDAGLAFAVAFGLFFLMWMIGAGGGGDAKLMGAVSVWLGFRQTLALMFLSTLLVVLLSLIYAAARKLRAGFARSAEQYREQEKAESERRRLRRKRTREEKIADRQQRRIMAYAVPVALSVWILILAEVSDRMPKSLQKPRPAAEEVRFGTTARHVVAGSTAEHRPGTARVESHASNGA